MVESALAVVAADLPITSALTAEWNQRNLLGPSSAYELPAEALLHAMNRPNAKKSHKCPIPDAI